MEWWNRRQGCRLLFLLICVLPVLIAVGYFAQRNWLRSVADRQWLADCLGVRLEADSWQYPAPGVVCLRGLSVYDLESKLQIARLEGVRFARRPGDLLITAERATIPAGEWPRWIDQVHEHLLRREACWPDHVHWRIDRLSIECTHEAGPSSQAPLHVQNLTCELDRPSFGSKLHVQFWLAQSLAGDPIQIKIERDRQPDGITTRCEVDTKRHALPCWVLTSPYPAWRSRLESAKFCGSIWLECADETWNGEVAGDLNHLLLDQLLAAPFPYELRGEAHVLGGHARIRAGRLEHLSGSLRAGPGMVSPSLCRDISQAWQTTAPPAPSAETDSSAGLPFTQLAAYFELDHEGLRLVGECDPSVAGLVSGLDSRESVLLMQERGPLVQTTSQPLPSVELIKMLGTHGETLVPASPAALWLSARIPLPDVSRR